MEDNSTTTQPQQDVIEEAKTYLAYKFGIGLDLYYLPVALTVGVVANIISFLVMMMKHNRSISCCVYIAFLAICDLGQIAMTWYFYLKWTIKVSGPSTNVWECKFVVWTSGCCVFSSTYFVVVMTVDRYLAICHPHRFHTIRRSRTALKIGACVMACFALYTAPFLFTANFIGGFCAGVATVSKLSSMYSMLNVVMGSVVPFSVLIVLNGFIARAVWKRKRTVEPQNNADNAGNKETSGTKKGEKQLIAMLFLVSGALLVLNLPIYIRFLLAVTIDYKSSATAYANFMLFYHIANKLTITNNAINFFLYIIGGKRFRRDVLQLFGRGSGGGGGGGAVTTGTGTTAAP